MATKRPRSPELISNPFIKKCNLEWSLDIPSHPQADEEQKDDEEAGGGPSLSAALESGAATHRDPAAHFFAHLAGAALEPYPKDTPRLPPAEFRHLFERSVGSDRGAHFVVHQHDHPVAGTHYDLRLQVNGASSVSWAVMYGLPGDPNSKRLNRNATETRVHCLWNHVVETGSAETGSLVIWDCGTYEVLPRVRPGVVDPDSGGEEAEEEEREDENEGTEQEKLARAFRERKIRVRLRGWRLPRDYVLNLRLTKGEDAEGRRKSARALGKPRRRRRRGGIGEKAAAAAVETSSDDDDEEEEQRLGETDVVPEPGGGEGEKGLTEMERELRELEDEEVRRTNAYKGAENSVGSMYQRRWYLSLDREGSGFVKGRRGWVRDREKKEEEEDDGGSGRLRFPFYVKGPEVERSVITGRLGEEVLRDEGVVGFVKRRGWKPVLN
ncbi:uncharacterized protein CTRU02_209717 [Colletotrichum truncatum]|uniref:Uncharacterized protein n=1 Tax=Colletotrichum truncatum TaxID=5467 RepID=A0ACC3YTB5_COLTU|nr:uncharacterized protein CTRU02_02285 [Colletotrichum truncatum]KAF6798312.1 hypothetical protein CTRU02_02285 [Colletotrichum truncatum]